MRQIFAKEGCEVITASNWETALKLILNIDIDYMVLNAKGKDFQAAISHRGALKR